jgi:tRNA wybutosine-synthesizing protein 3
LIFESYYQQTQGLAWLREILCVQILHMQTMTFNGSFQRKKQRILDALGVPLDDYTDLSPKGSVDEQIRDLIDEINAISELVTTSSCAGRVSVFVEGPKRSKKAPGALNKEFDENFTNKLGDRWLYVSHDPTDVDKASRKGWYTTFGLTSIATRDSQESKSKERDVKRLVHFKFEPMVRTFISAG